ncbi:MAG: hypothetical protein JRD93_06400 [Deltaproteobacteria bacterium]|nr:hypothetical protein [Deltaproteobacteria bacterium]MBW2661607.1 hypothetical protein [Deltaproteobacteria bacterium]
MTMRWISRKMLIIFFFGLLMLLCKERVATGQENNWNLNPSGQAINRKICLDDSISLSIFGKEIFEKELEAICGKGLGEVQANSGGHIGISGKIILWDEVNAQNTTGIKFTNRGNSIANVQKNSLIIRGK